MFRTAAIFSVVTLLGFQSAVAQPIQGEPGKRVGIIGLDTSHATEFTKMLNAPDAAPDLGGFRVVAAYPKGSAEIESSVKRVPEYTEVVKKLGVEIVDSIDTLLTKVDVVLLETNDGRPHLEQAMKVFRAGKPVFIDKPLASSLADVVAIYKAAEHYKVPVFTSSSLRYTEGAQAIRKGSVGEVVGADAYSPAHLEKSHPDLFWYGIHGVETLYTLMGTGCESVTRTQTPGAELVVGKWKGGRIGTFRGIREGKMDYGCTVVGSKGIAQAGTYQGYRPLLVEITRFFQSRQVPVAAAESVEIYAFMEAADESKRRGGAVVKIKDVMDKATREAEDKLSKLLK